jgi:hypothetical protein
MKFYGSISEIYIVNSLKAKKINNLFSWCYRNHSSISIKKCNLRLLLGVSMVRPNFIRFYSFKSVKKPEHRGLSVSETLCLLRINRICNKRNTAVQPVAYPLTTKAEDGRDFLPPLSGRFVREAAPPGFGMQIQLLQGINYLTHDSFKQPNEELHASHARVAHAEPKLQSSPL